MWKFVTRGIRETLERRTCRTNVYSQSSQDNPKVKTNTMCQQRFLAPIFLTCNKNFWGSSKTAGTRDKQHDSKWNANYSWPEAVGWSSILTAGWVVCQTFCLRKRIFERDSNDFLKNKVTIVSHLLSQILDLQPNRILPITNCVGNDSGTSNQQNSDSQCNAEQQFGPMTIEEVFKEAADEITNAHKMVIGECELRYGITALKDKRYKDAMTHFSAGAKLSSPESTFNLGLCYELGIGTFADQKKAAKYYNDAAAYNHADALYNLGVFHAQGKGGLPINIDVARSYFIRAAELGQVQAQHALNLEKSSNQKNNNILSNTCLKNINLKKNTGNNATNKLNNYKDPLNTDFVAKSTMSEYNEKIVENPTQVFLDFLYSRETNQTIMTTTNNYSVPC